MPITISDATVRIEDACTVEDALPLLEALRANPGATVMMGTCSQLHTASLQVLLALQPPIAALPTDPFLARWIAPLLTQLPHELRGGDCRGSTSAKG